MYHPGEHLEKINRGDFYIYLRYTTLVYEESTSMTGLPNLQTLQKHSIISMCAFFPRVRPKFCDTSNRTWTEKTSHKRKEQWIHRGTRDAWGKSEMEQIKKRHDKRLTTHL